MIAFDISAPGAIDLSVYNIVGQKVATLANGSYRVGSYNVIWNGRDSAGNPAASGIYYYRLKTGDNVETKKMTLLK
jgi:flagellar hook assembly protein FlgD